MPSDLSKLRSRAISNTFFRPTTLPKAVDLLGFIQADPIRSPARAQDLILRHRVGGYRQGDLERRYESLELEEEYFYAYGFLKRSAWPFVRRTYPAAFSKFEKLVLATVGRLGPTHPRDLDAHFGRKQVKNDWGGFSQATKRALERLHLHSHLRVARRENGVRVYEPAPPFDEKLTPSEKLHAKILLLASALGPVRTGFLRLMAGKMRDGSPVDHLAMIKGMLESGELEQTSADGIGYIWAASPARPAAEPSDVVRFLAPFDPLVWDRRRFSHFWQWDYRFEAYTPPAKRVRGYYAMPVLHRENVIGWANAKITDGKLSVDLGFVGPRPRDRAFRHEVDAEIERLTIFLGL